jgi:hypothetical protein
MRWLFVVAFLLAPLYGDILYEEHFSEGFPSLDWYPFFEAYVENTDTMQVHADQSAPDGDGYVGYVGEDWVGMAFAGAPDLHNYSVEAWVYLNVVSGTGPYQGLGIRIDYVNQEFFNFIADLDDSRRLRLAHIVNFMPVVIKEWQESEIPGGLPTEDGWHRMKVTVVKDSFWCYFDGQLLPGCPYIYSDGPSEGFFGVYYYLQSGGASVKVDSIIVKSAPEAVEESRGITPVKLSVTPNPFVDRVVLEATGLAETAPLTIFSVSGRKIAEINPTVGSGSMIYIWMGKDQLGREVAPGTYFLLLKGAGKPIPVIKLK